MVISFTQRYFYKVINDSIEVSGKVCMTRQIAGSTDIHLV